MSPPLTDVGDIRSVSFTWVQRGSRLVREVEFVRAGCGRCKAHKSVTEPTTAPVLKVDDPSYVDG